MIVIPIGCRDKRANGHRLFGADRHWGETAMTD